MSEFYRCSICGNPMFAGYLCPKCSANGLKSCEVKTTNWQEQKTIAELQKRIAELEAQLRWRPVSEGNLPATNVKVEKTKQCRSCHGTGTAWLMGSIHGEDVCEKCGGVGWIEMKHECELKIILAYVIGVSHAVAVYVINILNLKPLFTVIFIVLLGILFGSLIHLLTVSARKELK